MTSTNLSLRLVGAGFVMAIGMYCVPTALAQDEAAAQAERKKDPQKSTVRHHLWNE